MHLSTRDLDTVDPRPRQKGLRTGACPRLEDGLLNICQRTGNNMKTSFLYSAPHSDLVFLMI